MRLNQNVYRLKTKSGIIPEPVLINDLKLCINGEITEHDIQSLFLKLSSNTGYIKGWSILQRLQKQEEFYSLFHTKGKEVTVSFKIEDSEEEFFITSISTPMVQFADRELPKDQILEDLTKLRLLSSASEEEVEDESESAQPQTDESETPSEEALINEEYEGLKSELIEAGYDERVLKDYRIFTKERREPIIVRVTENDYIEFETEDIFPYHPISKDKNYTQHHFTDYNMKMTATLNISEDTFEIMPVIESNTIKQENGTDVPETPETQETQENENNNIDEEQSIDGHSEDDNTDDEQKGELQITATVKDVEEEPESIESTE